jgi:exodeoxyribonuclease V gamma subunit
MPLVVHRSQRVEVLVDHLADAIGRVAPADPFAAVPIVVGSRGMQRWLRHALAARLGGVAGLEFLFPASAFAQASRWVLTDAATRGEAPRWSERGRQLEAWTRPRLTHRVLAAFAALGDADELAEVRRYLDGAHERARPVRRDEPSGAGALRAVDARTFRFADQVAAAVVQLLHDRPDDVARWLERPETVEPEHRWLASLLAALGADARADSPLVHFQSTRRASPAGTARGSTAPALFVFGLSTLRPGDKLRFAALAPHLTLHVLSLAPSSEWWDDIRGARHQNRQLVRARPGEPLQAVLAAIADDNLMLAANGGPSGDLQRWLEELGYEEPGAPVVAEPAAIANERTTLLARVQQWIDRAEQNPKPSEAPWRAEADCPSLEVHGCHGPLRQCEALRDALLRRFAADPTLEPRDVLVMTPKLDVFAPLLSAVLTRASATDVDGQEGQSEGAPALPVHVADLGLRATNPFAEALMLALGAADQRVTQSLWLELLACAPVRARFDIADDEVADLREMIETAGIRWGIDAADRAAHDQPALDQNTLRFGLERLALGVLMPDAGGLFSIAPSDGLGPAVPFELGTRERAERFGRFAALAEAVVAARAALVTPATAAEWRTRLAATLDRLTAPAEANDPRARSLRWALDQSLDELLPSDAGDEPSAPPRLLDRAAVAAMLEGAFDQPIAGDRPPSAAITVCALEPMRSVPFRVIAIVGLDESEFPRGGSTASWNPFRKAREGEYDARAVDRHLFLEALLCARDSLLLFGTAFSERRGEPRALATPVAELCELIAAGTGRALAEVVHLHPLQPWSERAFADASLRPLRPFDAAWAAGARARREPHRIEGAAATRADVVWPADLADPSALPGGAIEASALAATLAEPQRELLERRLGLPARSQREEGSDRETLDVDRLAARGLRADAIGALVTDDEALAAFGALDARERLAARLAAIGALPIGAKGARTLETTDHDARAVLARAQAIGGEAIASRTVVHRLADGRAIRAQLAELRAQVDGRIDAVHLTASRAASSRFVLAAWIAALVASAAGAPLETVHVITADPKECFAFAPPADASVAAQALETLVEIARAARSGPLMLFPKLSWAVAERARKKPDEPPRRWIEGARAAWEGTPNGLPGDQDDDWVKPLYGDRSIDDLADEAATIAELARRVFEPLLIAIDLAAANAKQAAKAEKEARTAPKGAATRKRGTR